MKLLFIGDIVGRPGRDLVRRHVRALAASVGAHLVIANGENAAGGAGITRDNANEVLAAGVDVISSGNHIWDKRETVEFIGGEPRLLRPANYPDGTPGAGSCVVNGTNGVRVGVINVMGRLFMQSIDDPFRTAEREIARVKQHGAQVIFVDMHAETTSEKIALSYYLDGKVAAVIGTHTHVQTADERILPGGTACLTDVGMTGPHDGVIGIEKEAIIARFVTGLPGRFETATGDPRLNGVSITADPATGRATGIERISLSEEQLKEISDNVTAAARS
ncbi:MAG TPA: TIGR00282 family metallophosphoesterase [Vicinamibacterales bacterium]|nr:TIGR00282 family metallophosphoesterase [Vicinamibacterales bacterium]